MTFARPLVFLLLLTLPLWWWRRRSSAGVRFGDTRMLGGAARGQWRAALPAALRSLAVFALTVAAAGPETGPRRLETRREGIAIVVAIDVSSSMLAEDFAPQNRLEVAKRQALAFVQARAQDRIGIVTFAGEALTKVPLTGDQAALERAIADIRIGDLEDGTAIGSGLVTAVNRLRRARDTSKVVLLLTDGENNRGTVDPRTAAATAAAFGIRVYTVGVGTEGEAPIPTGRGPGGLRYEVLPVRIDEALLGDVARVTGGRYFRARDSEALARIFHQIDQLEKTVRVEPRELPRDEATAPCALAGLGFLLAELLVSSTLVVRVT